MAKRESERIPLEELCLFYACGRSNLRLMQVFVEILALFCYNVVAISNTRILNAKGV